jgi:4-hydroxy-3-methylbut-2-enyl diphosphate reductase
VKAIQLKVKHAIQDGYTVILIGDRHHTEVIGVQHYAGDSKKFFIVGTEDEAKGFILTRDKSEKIMIVAQTTLRFDAFAKIADRIKQYFYEVETIWSICNATADRQQALVDLCDSYDVDAVVVIGDKTSNNSRELFETAKNRKPAEFVEKVADLPEYLWDLKRIGLTAAASVPEQLIHEIDFALRIQETK